MKAASSAAAPSADRPAAPPAAPVCRVLQVAAEVFPLVKTGGLGDVMAALPQALVQAGADVRLLLPGYPEVLGRLTGATLVSLLGPCFGAASIMVRSGRVEGVEVPCYVIDAPALYDRPGNPYLDAAGKDWSDNLLRFGALSWLGAHLALGDVDRSWRPHIVHAHDWHAALAPVYLHGHPGARARSVFTVHNLAFHGPFERSRLGELLLPQERFTLDGLEFHGKGSFMKGALQFADRVTTVSPSYAREIQTAEFGCGLDGVIRARKGLLSGILNGIDPQIWNPARDPQVPVPYDVNDPSGKAAAKALLQREAGLKEDPATPLFAVVSRLTTQKGIDLVVQAAGSLLNEGGQLVVLGSGDLQLETALRTLAAAHPGRIGVRFGYHEAFAHKVIAGADVIMVPSRFEPCGLTQLYGLRYGTLPLVRKVGGLADTVVDADSQAIADDRATGFMFQDASASGLSAAIRRTLALYRQPARWQQVMRRAMQQDFSWRPAAAAYISLYRDVLGVSNPAPAVAAAVAAGTTPATAGSPATAASTSPIMQAAGT